MAYKTSPLTALDVSSTKDKIIEILSQEFPLSVKKIHAVLKNNYSCYVTYQAVHKLLILLEKEKVVVKNEKKSWMLDGNWIEDRLLFFKNLNSTYQRKNNILGSKIKVFAFDVNGVLTPEMTHVEFAKHTPHYEEIKKLIAMQTLGKIPIKEAFTKMSKLVAGISLYDLMEYSRNFKLMAGLEEMVKQLKKYNIKICLITTGFKIAMDAFNQRLGGSFDYIVCNEFVFIDEKRKVVPDKITQDIIKSNDVAWQKKIVIKSINIIIDSQEKKTHLLKKYLKRNHLTFKDACCVGDSMGDADMIKIASEEGGIGIAFNPNLSLIEYANYLKKEGHNVKIVESKDLRDILSLFV